MQSYHRLESLMNLTPGYRREFIVAGRQMLLLQEGAVVALLENRCPHQGFSLVDARVKGHTLTCAAHAVSFSLLNGEVQPGAAFKCGALKIYELAYRGNEVGVYLE
ncbi:MAG TPA: Rieske (2Fe-2S) protein [Pseudomonadales bacterium]|nr:Rieske (2Fe-2S) protein [Pseudomonadales bacterium]